MNTKLNHAIISNKRRELKNILTVQKLDLPSRKGNQSLDMISKQDPIGFNNLMTGLRKGCTLAA